MCPRGQGRPRGLHLWFQASESAPRHSKFLTTRQPGSHISTYQYIFAIAKILQSYRTTKCEWTFHPNYEQLDCKCTLTYELYA